MTYKRKLLVGLLVLAIVVGGGLWFLFGRSANDNQQRAGTDWKAVSVNGTNLVDNSYVSLYFLDKQPAMGGYSGVNDYGGNYSAEAPDLKLFRIIMTLVLGPDPKINDQEKTYVHYLGDAASYRVDDNQLKMFEAAGQQGLVFERIPDYPMNPRDPIGTSWHLVNANGANVTERHFTTLVDKSGTSANGTAKGYDGIFDYRFTYQANRDNIMVTLSTVGRISDLPPDAGQDFFGLTGITKYRLTKDRLELITYKGDTYIFEPLGSP